MLDTFKFPNKGYDVTVYRKDDIIDDLDTDIDKQIVDIIITQCEKDAINFLGQGKWTGIPYLGNMRVSKFKEKRDKIKGKEILEAAKDALEENRYKAFRKQLTANIAKEVKIERFRQYQTSMFVTKNRKIYNWLLTNSIGEQLINKESYARFMCYSFIKPTFCKGEEYVWQDVN